MNGSVGRWIEYEIHKTINQSFKQERRGRPNAHTKYKRSPRTEYHIFWKQRVENIEYDAKSDGMFPLITNCEDLSLTDVLDIYKYQPKLEKRHQQLKSVYDIAPVFLKSVTRIEGFLFVYYIALLVQALIEREIRINMNENGVKSLPLYFEGRKSTSPTTNKVLSHFNNIEFHRLWSGNTVIKTFNSSLSYKQRQLLGMTGVPIESYTELG